MTLLTEEGRRRLLTTYREGLQCDVLPFWVSHGVDREMGGFWTAVDDKGNLVDTDKSVWFQGRATWMFATVYLTESTAAVEERTEWLAIARQGIKFIDEHCFDTSDPLGRMWFTLTRDGRPLRKRRYAYSESFACISHAVMAGVERAAGGPEDRIAYHVKRARELFELFTSWNFTPGLMPAKFTDVRPMVGICPRMITIATAQELRKYLPASHHEYLNSWIDRCINDIRTLFMKPEFRVVMEAVAPDGSIEDHFDGRILNPGHAIEGAWFVMHEGKARGRQDYIATGLQMLDWMWERGWDTLHGGLYYFRDVYNKPVQEYWQDMKFWWPHNEAVIATLLAYSLTKDPKYAEWHQLVHDWSHTHFKEPGTPEWFGYLHNDGTIATRLKGTMWKGPFHLPRMQWYCEHLLEELMA
ncbi:N-acylglucosamine 2-epimerase [Pelomyxa schiedti]|nr:N-acylglucosamine 2-epimerase [Pelomyxa schiedti]